MKQPTDRMLIDALCIVMAQHLSPRDLFRDLSPTMDVIVKAREIVTHYAPMAIARILREQDESLTVPVDTVGEQPDWRTDPRAVGVLEIGQSEHVAWLPGDKLDVTVHPGSPKFDALNLLFRTRDATRLQFPPNAGNPNPDRLWLVMSKREIGDGRWRFDLHPLERARYQS